MISEILARLKEPEILDKAVETFKKIPVANLLPVVASVLNQIPAAWESLPDERKQEVIQNLMVAGAKYAAKGAV